MNQDFQIEILDSSAQDYEIERVLTLSRGIFGGNQDEEGQQQNNTAHFSLDAWRARLRGDRRARIFCFYHYYNDRGHGSGRGSDGEEEQEQEEEEEEKKKIGGFFFCLPKVQAPELDFETLHVWIAGVHPDLRGKGVFLRLLNETRQYASEAGFQWLTVCTFPERFERMWGILRRGGWEVVGWRTDQSVRGGGGEEMKQDEGERKKVLMKLRV